MSLGAEYIADHMYELESEYFFKEITRIKQQAKKDALKGLWITKDGEKLSVHKMTESHIQNCINMLKRNHSPLACFYIPMFQKELEKRYESAF